jgi:reticulon-4-interacting protein 1, mitochondrial
MDFVVDFVGGKEVEKDGMKVLKKSGKFVTAVGPVQYLGDEKLEWIGIAKLFFYICWRILHSQYKKPNYGFVVPTKSIFPVFMEMLETNSIKPIVDEVINFNEQEIKKTVNYVKTHRTSGKAVIQINHT